MESLYNPTPRLRPNSVDATTVANETGYMLDAPNRLVLPDETGRTAKMARLRGGCPKGQRLRFTPPLLALEDPDLSSPD